MSWLGAIADVGMGLLGMGGQASTNRANRDMAREQMRFQERMSSTAAQRSVEDYRKAGLNPALAYERSASTPGGASAVIGNAVEKGISTAQQSRELRQSLDIARQQNKADIALKNNQAEAAHAAAMESWQRTQQAFHFQPYLARQMAAKASLDEYMTAGGARRSDVESTIHKIIAPGLSSARAVSELIRRKFNLPPGGK